MSRNIVFQIAAALSAFVATPVFAADMAVKAPPPVPIAINWTGCYVNAGAGSGYFTQEFHRTVDGVQTTVDQTAGAMAGWVRLAAAVTIRSTAISLSVCSRTMTS